MANIGDSRAVLGSRDGGGMVAVQLTVDLKPDVPSMPPYAPSLFQIYGCGAVLGI
jgi:hypothetical protein